MPKAVKNTLGMVITMKTKVFSKKQFYLFLVGFSLVLNLKYAMQTLHNAYASSFMALPSTLIIVNVFAQKDLVPFVVLMFKATQSLSNIE